MRPPMLPPKAAARVRPARPGPRMAARRARRGPARAVRPVKPLEVQLARPVVPQAAPQARRPVVRRAPRTAVPRGMRQGVAQARRARRTVVLRARPTVVLRALRQGVPQVRREEAAPAADRAVRRRRNAPLCRAAAGGNGSSCRGSSRELPERAPVGSTCVTHRASFRLPPSAPVPAARSRGTARPHSPALRPPAADARAAPTARRPSPASARTCPSMRCTACAASETSALSGRAIAAPLLCTTTSPRASANVRCRSHHRAARVGVAPQ